MQTKSAQKNSKIIVKHTSGRVINEPHIPSKGRIVVDSKIGYVAPKCSAILAVETKNERKRTIREYEKQRDILRSVIAR